MTTEQEKALKAVEKAAHEIHVIDVKENTAFGGTCRVRVATTIKIKKER